MLWVLDLETELYLSGILPGSSKPVKNTQASKYNLFPSLTFVVVWWCCWITQCWDSCNTKQENNVRNTFDELQKSKTHIQTHTRMHSCNLVVGVLQAMWVMTALPAPTLTSPSPVRWGWKVKPPTWVHLCLCLFPLGAGGGGSGS